MGERPAEDHPQVLIIARASTTSVRRKAAGPTKSFAAIKRALLAERRASIGTADEALVSEIGAIFATADAKAGIEAYLRGDLAGVSFVGA
jgi:hypothetical protein